MNKINMEKLSMCRMCLAVNVRMYLIGTTHLHKLYEALTTVAFITEDRRPIQVCYICYAKLKNCFQLKEMCLQSEALFTEMLGRNMVHLLDGSRNQRLSVLPVRYFCVGTEHLATTCEDSVIKVEATEDVAAMNQDVEEIDAHSNCPETQDGMPLSIVKREPEQIWINVPRETPDDAGIDQHIPFSVEIIKRELDEFEINVPREAPEDAGIDRIDSVLKTKPSSCDTCRKSFKSKFHLRKHVCMHRAEKSFMCNICKQSFRNKVSLVRHISIHTGEKPYKCDICNKCFREKVSLDRHIRIHTGEKPYKCDICEKCFREKGSLDRHIRIHTGEKPYKCNICTKCFSQKSNLDSHIRIHTDEKPYECNICNKCFSQSSHLEKHSRIHTGEKPYECNMCNKRFRHSNTLSKHIRTHSGQKVL